MKKKVLFVCTYNSVRSQMAEGLLRALRGKDYESFSAGTAPAGVNPYAIKVMAEANIDISKHRSKSIDELSDKEFDIVVTVCDQAKEACPHFPNAKKRIHKGFEDPGRCSGSEEEKLAAFRRVRDEMREWIEKTFT